MSTPRQVPSLALQRQSFSRANQPAIAHPMMVGSQPAPPPDSTAEAIDDLAQEIYARLAIDHIAQYQVPDSRALRELAARARTAATAYFEGGSNE